MKKPKIMVVCAFGLGTSMVLKLTVDKVLKAEGLEATTFCTDEATAKGQNFDMVFTSAEMVKLFKGLDKPVVVINNFLSKDEVREKGVDIIRDLCQR
jgi:PTS system ascorbate-specific IIB component